MTSISELSNSKIPAASGDFENVPNPIIQLIMSFLSPKEMARTQRVCKNFWHNAQLAIMQSGMLHDLKKMSSCTLHIFGMTHENLKSIQPKEAFVQLHKCNIQLTSELDEFREKGTFMAAGWIDGEEFDAKREVKPLNLFDKLCSCVQNVKDLFMMALETPPATTLSIYKQFLQMVSAAEKASIIKISTFNQVIQKEFNLQIWIDKKVTLDKLRAAVILFPLVNKRDVPKFFLENAILSSNSDAISVILKNGVDVDSKLFKLAERSTSVEIREIFKELREEMGFDDEVGERIEKSDPLDLLAEALRNQDSDLLSRLMSHAGKVIPNISRFIASLSTYLTNETDENRQLARTFIYGLTNYLNDKEIGQALTSVPNWIKKEIDGVLKQAFNDQSLQS